MSDFIKSVDAMVAKHFAYDAIRELQKAYACDVKDWSAAERILKQLIRTSIAHARSQVEGRKTGTMTFDEAMRLVREHEAMVTRPGWNIFRTIVAEDDDGFLWNFKLDNCDGMQSGGGVPYKPTDEDCTATDWMIYQSPDHNWVELDFDGPDA